jgi:hypothetical protein
MADVLRVRATEGSSDWPKRPILLCILITLATIAGAVILPSHGASAPVFTENGWSTSVTPDGSSVRAGDTITLRVTVSTSTARTGLVDLEITDPTGRKVFQRSWKARSFAADTPRTFTANWAVPLDEPLGQHIVHVGIFRADWGELYHWNHFAATVTVTAEPTATTTVPAPTTTSAPTTTTTTTTTTTPPPSGRFNLLPPGAILPTSQQCVSRVRRAPEVRPVNQRPNRFGDIPNQTRGVAGAWVDGDPTKAPFTARVDGNFVGTTDEIIQWAACKWGVDEDYVRAQIVTESYWDQVNSLGDWGSTSTRCEPRFPLGTDGRSGQCPESFGLGQTRYPYMRSAFPYAYDSSAYNLDVTYAFWRSCFEGTETWLNTVERGRQYQAGDMLGCMGRWFAGRWYTQDALDYMAVVQRHEDQRTWESPEFLSYDP